ncbi:hypothetical protein ACFQE5_21910 [Pseudonocardia hispaniensis]|uniref:Uncharacterized protein n=1 Tax=Pseudonocardia hispaniensis TaxID=904933 RepID=A0ABW1J7R0_9PSEU
MPVLPELPDASHDRRVRILDPTGPTPATGAAMIAGPPPVAGGPSCPARPVALVQR